MTEYEPDTIESRWRERWNETGQFEAEPDGDTTFVTVPYPYPNGGMHVGHVRTYTVPDVFARYRRLQGENVLFPIGWHVTGTPIVGAVERLNNDDTEQREILTDTFDVPEATLEDLDSPMAFAQYFIDTHYKANMEALGLSIDWRRTFTTTDERYQRFITWQYETLNDRGLLERGLHPVSYCIEQDTPVTTHDILVGDDVESQEYTLLKFETDDAIVPMATLRPETIHGVTNAFVNPDGRYVRATVDGDTWIVAADAVVKLEHQTHDVEIEAQIEGEALVGETVTNPVTGAQMPILPASFVDTANATGVVMSVPAHSPDDWLALKTLENEPERLEPYDIDPEIVAEIEPTAIADVEGYGELPARDAVEFRAIDSVEDPELETITQELYSAEFHNGRLRAMYDDYEGELIGEVRTAFRDDLVADGVATTMFDFPEPVISRAGGKVIIAEQETWFLRYNDQDWTEKAYDALDGLQTIPPSTADQFDHAIDWLEAWPCIRNYGLGTPLPMDEEFIIEPLSDSTLYMAYYTIAHRLEDLPIEKLTHEFFDAVFFGPGAVDDPDDTARSLHEEFDAWYPVDVRCSGGDLVPNHLTFYLYHHAELFEKPYWPETVTSMGMGLLDGSAMSSSKGHVVLAGTAIEEYGADTVRFFLLNNAEPWQDFDWRDERVEDTHRQLKRFYDRAQSVIDSEIPDERPELEQIDKWLLSKLQHTVQHVTDALEAFETRTASQECFYRFEDTLRWYRRRTETDRPGARWTLATVLETRLKLLAPFIPHLANDCYEALTDEPVTNWPVADTDAIDRGIELEESLVDALTDDITAIQEVIEKDPEEISVYVRAPWKREVFDVFVEAGPDHSDVMDVAMDQENLKSHAEQVNDLVSELVDRYRGTDEGTLERLEAIDEASVYSRAIDFLEDTFDADVTVAQEADVEASEQEYASDATPFRPAVRIE
ncbi:leucine--tRNA ligase [Halocatena halophila]|uniref:leucine--tRNA ligase n=1 Tax=Halocatena halophila TaxID=2814576 RepID=UPI002ED47D86